MANDKNKGGEIRPVTVTIHDALSGHRHLFNKICEEKRITEGLTKGDVFNRMVWDEATRLFGLQKTKQIFNDYWLGNDN